MTARERAAMLWKWLPLAEDDPQDRSGDDIITRIERDLDAHAADAVAAERARCLKIVELRSRYFGGEPLTQNEAAIVQSLAKAITVDAVLAEMEDTKP